MDLARTVATYGAPIASTVAKRLRVIAIGTIGGCTFFGLATAEMSDLLTADDPVIQLENSELLTECVCLSISGPLGFEMLEKMQEVFDGKATHKKFNATLKSVIERWKTQEG